MEIFKRLFKIKMGLDRSEVVLFTTLISKRLCKIEIPSNRQTRMLTLICRVKVRIIFLSIGDSAKILGDRQKGSGKTEKIIGRN